MDSQLTIKTWFDNTYSKRGELYLRPVKAYEIFIALLNPKKGDKILDVACGLGRLLTAAQKKELDLYGIDISTVAIDKAKKILPKANLVEGNAETLPYQNKLFDFVSCLGSLERMLDRDKALIEMHRVLSDDGQLCLFVRNSKSWKWQFIKKPFGLVNKDGHQDALNMEEWIKLLGKNNFEVAYKTCDQWPMMKFKWIITLGLWRSFDKVLSCFFSLEYANEFLFICKKKGDPK